MLLKKYSVIFCMVISFASASSDFTVQAQKYKTFSGAMQLYKKCLLDNYKKNVSEEFDRLLLFSKEHLIKSTFVSVDMTQQDAQLFINTFTKELYRTISPEFEHDMRNSQFIFFVQCFGAISSLFGTLYGERALHPWLLQLAPFFVSFLLQSSLAAHFVLRGDFLKKEAIVKELKKIVDFHLKKKKA